MIKKEDQQQLMITALTGVGVVVAVSVFQNIDTSNISRQMSTIVSNRSTGSDTATAGSGMTSQTGGMGSSSGGSSSGGSSSDSSSSESNSTSDESTSSEDNTTSSADEAGLKKFEASDSNMTVTPLVVDDIVAYGEIIDINDSEVAILFDEQLVVYPYGDKVTDFSVGDYVIITKDGDTNLLRELLEF
ncbi:MAG: hypothetical protein ATN35_06400 [Epulopiscium sp. Nele67-Bin004]|nr:MAG: hypothetical protein ATN35_06400 [Epulopiscium sp. Nele67-Bin004]